MSIHGPLNGVKISRMCFSSSQVSYGITDSIVRHVGTAIDDPHKVVKVIASDGKSGETRNISYSNCKVVGNGSFGVVFSAKIVGPPNDGEEVAIKKVLQDKRFKVCSTVLPHITRSPNHGAHQYIWFSIESRAPSNETCLSSKCCKSESLFLLEW